MRHLVKFGFNLSGSCYRGTAPAEPPVVVQHEYLARDDGQLEHRMDGRLCAVVPPEGFDGYAEAWPDAAPVIDTLRGAEKSARATTKAPAKKPSRRR